MNQQEAFDIVLTKLRGQKVASISADGSSCLYQSAYGCCAVGHLLPDSIELNDPNENSVHVSQLLDNYADELDHLADLSQDFLHELQVTHDLLLPLPTGVEESRLMKNTRMVRFGTDRGIESWEAGMAELAVKFGLNYTAPEAAAC